MLRSLAAAALAGALAATAAPAQVPPEVPSPLSPLRVEPDHNGVNLVTGRIEINGPSLSVPAAPNLRLDTHHHGAPILKGAISGSGEGYSAGSYTIKTGLGSSESFTCPFDSEGICNSVTGTGSTFIPGLRQFRQAGSGAVWKFNLKSVDNISASPRTLTYYASSISYPNGETISYGYTTTFSNGTTYYRPTSISSNLGYTISMTYQSEDIESVAWGQLSVATLHPSGSPGTPLGRLTYTGNFVTDLGGRVYACPGCGQEAVEGSLQLPGEAVPALQATRHPTAPVVTSVIRDGVTWTYSYANLRPSLLHGGYLYDKITVDGPNGFHMVHDIAASNKRNILTRSTDALGRPTSYAFDTTYRVTAITLPEGNKVDLGYDDHGNIYSRTTIPKPGSGLSPVIETAYFDEAKCNLTTPVLCYRPDHALDGLSRRTDFVYNDRGQLTEQTAPADPSGVRRKTFITYETSLGISRPSVVRICGLGSTCGTNAEIRTEYVYWGQTFLPSLERKIDAAQGVTLETNYSYDSAGRLLSADGPLPGTDDAVYNRYDVHGRKIWEIGPRAPNDLRLAKFFTYRPADDRLVSTEQGTIADLNNPVLSVQSRSDVAYDSRRNPEREWVSAGGVADTMVQRSFQDSGRLDCEARRMNRAAFASLPASACTLGAQGSYGADRIAHNLYDSAGQLLTVQRAYGTPRQQNYASYQYTLNGKPKAVTDANNNRAEMSWDGFDRQKRWTFPSKTVAGAANPADYEEYGYDLVGNRTSLRKRDGAMLGFQYDALNRMIFKDVPEAGGDVAYAYDVRGLQLSALYASTGLGIASAYDGFGRQISTTTNLDGTSRTYAFQYDSAGNRSRVAHPDGPWFDYGHDALGRMTTLKDNAGTTLVTLAYHPAGERASAAYANGVHTSYGYDQLGRLTGLTHGFAGTAQDVTYAYAYNPASQIVSRTIDNDLYAFTKSASSIGYGVNGLNQYVQVAGGAVVHDPNGNLTQEGGRTLGYDSENKLVSGSSTAGGSPFTVGYDPQGRLRALFVGASTIGFDMVGTDITTLRINAGPAIERYAFGPGVDEPMVGYDNAGTRYYFHADGHGNVVANSNAAGTATRTIGYDDYGRPSTFASRFLHAGKIHIGTLNAYYNNARFYDYNLGRFLQVDPVGYRDQINLYTYVGNDPVNLTDPSGNNPACAPQCFEQVHTRTRNDDYRDLVDADAWEEAFSSLKEGNYAAALGSTLKGAIAVAGLSPPGRATQPLAVIGHYSTKTGGYVALAQKLGARFFQVPMQAWNRMTPAQQWAANTRFLDRQIRDGAVFRLSTRAQDAVPGSAFAKEVEHLKKNGYEISRDGYSMTKSPCNTASTRLCH